MHYKLTLKYYKMTKAKGKIVTELHQAHFHNLNKCTHLAATGVNHQLCSRYCERTFVIEGYSQTMNSSKRK